MEPSPQQGTDLLASTGAQQPVPENPPVWEDITKTLNEASEELVSGQIVKLESFSLYEAMSALELMDPKMDSGMITGEILTFDEALQTGSIKPSSKLNVKEILGIMDKLFCYELAWYGGNTLSQTLFTCLYLHHTSVILDDLYLKPFILALINRISTIRKMILDADIYDEEDFASQTYGFTIKETDENELIDLLTKAEDELANREQKLTKSEQYTSPLQENKENEIEYVQALLSRIRFSKNWLVINIKFSKNRKAVAQTRKTIAIAKSQLPIIQRTQNLGEIPDKVFQPEIYRRLFVATHPRRITLASLDSYIEQITHTISQYEELLNITDYDSLDKLEQFLLYLIDQKADVLVRSAFMIYTFSGQKIFGQHDIQSWVIQNAKDNFEMPDKYFKFACVKEILDTVTKTYPLHFRVMASNKARRRRKLSALMREWSALAEEGDIVDITISKELGYTKKEDHVHYYFCWMLDKTLKCMVQYLKLGFELELYEEYEYRVIYWYLDCLLQQRKGNHQYIWNWNKTHKLQSTKKKQKKKANKKKTEIKEPTSAYHLEIVAEKSVCQGIYRMLSIISLDNKLPPEPQTTFGSSKNRYLTRFEAFLKVRTPHFLMNNIYEEQSDFSKHRVRLLELTAESFKKCRETIEKLNTHQNQPGKHKMNELKILLKVAISNSLNFSIIQKTNVLKDATKKINFDLNMDPSFAVISFK